MRKFSGLFILILSVIITVILFVLLDLSFFVNENRLKSILSESNFYDTAALYIKNEIVTKSDFKLNEGSNFEDLNQKITGENVKPVIDQAIHNIFISLDNPTDQTRIFPVQFDSQKDSGAQYSFEKYVNLEQNTIFDILSHRNKYLLLACGGLLILLSIGILIYSNKITDRLVYLSLYCLLSLIILLGMAVMLRFYLPNYIDIIVAKSQFFREPKLVVMTKKLITIMINKQTLYYLAEIIGLLIAGATALTIRKIYIKEKLDQIEEKI